MSRRHRISPWVVIVFLTGATACGRASEPTQTPTALQPTVATPSKGADDDLSERLALLSERLEAARVDNHVPGMAIVVVKDDEVIFAEGFGHSNIGEKRPVTPDTIFAIGSSTKAFTSAIVGTLADEGKLDWDDPIEKHVPEMMLPVRATDRRPTLRDAMSHRTGFTRMGVLWAGGGATPTQMYSTASLAEPSAKYRKSFLYCNVVYASAGEAAARASGRSWSQLVEERIFAPLKMTSSTTTTGPALGDPRRAQGYRYDQTLDKFEPVPMRNLDLIGPAGSINSNVKDMAQWLRLQLGRGEVDGTRVLSKERIEDTWSPQIEVGRGAKYGMGWFVRDWNGHRYVEHGGNIDGYAAAVGMLPDDGLGVVMLTNVSVTPLQGAVHPLVWDTLLGDLDEEGATGDPGLNLKPYVGKYVANFGPWNDARFTVTEQDGHLFLDVPMQTNYELLPPDSDGKWKFAAAPQVAASFERQPDSGDKGAVNVLRLHQGGLDFEMPREGWTPPAEIDLAAHRGYLGRYEAEDGKTSATVLLRGNRIAVDIPGQMVYELHAPDEAGKWRFRVKKDISVAFEVAAGDATSATSLTIHQAGTATKMTKKAGGPALPTVAEIAKLRRANKRTKAIGKLGLLEATGTVRMLGSGAKGKIRMIFDQTRARTEIDLGVFGKVIEVDNGKRAWSEGTMSPAVTEVHGQYLEQSHQAHPLRLVGDLATAFSSVAVAARTKVEDGSRVRVDLRTGELPVLQVFLDPKTGDIRETKGMRLLPGAGAMPVSGELSDYREVFGLRIPFVIRSEDQPSGTVIVEFDAVTVSKADPAKLFPEIPPKTP